MAKLRQRIIHDAGATNPSVTGREIDDQGGKGFVSAPRSGYAINESINLVFTDRNTKILEGYQDRLTLGDGDVRPGTV